jgi:hypothetical protein
MAFNINGTTGLTFNNGSTQDVGGVGTGSQTWQNVTASRVDGTTYTNTTGKPILVNLQGYTNSAGAAGVTGTCNGLIVAQTQPYAAGGAYGGFVSFIVPNGATYSGTFSGTNGFLFRWTELR